MNLLIGILCRDSAKAHVSQSEVDAIVSHSFVSGRLRKDWRRLHSGSLSSDSDMVNHG